MFEIVAVFFILAGSLFGLLLLFAFVFLTRRQSGCQTVLVFNDNDTEAEYIIRSVIFADKLLGRKSVPLVYDVGVEISIRQILERFSQNGKIKLIDAVSEADFV